ncbi:carboxymuconolactone decarboxylase family protein [Filobacillus milosensis]|uniref:Carboxymuconolactone decarboxylase family protein n=1 Tax=Filobacillus milosensis TaxID=94137 RepID=A0A4Y8IR54_9BACI|nr:carboxymuconolactone decarboxylase family protein [Filobacillus milosensis]TFB24036.1 carboxymuconolactone decarboxylase family protein [Filobacillus milosensis]
MEKDTDHHENFFDQSILDYKEGINHLKDKLPKMTQGYFDFTESCFEAGALDQKTKQLLALAISIYAQDEYCIIYHTKGAAEHQATEDEIMETVAVSAALGGGAAMAQGVTLTMDSYHHYTNNTH